MIESLLAGITIAVCLVLLIRLTLGHARQQRFDAGCRRGWIATRGSALNAWQTMRRIVLQAWHWPARRRHAAHLAEEAIRRAQGSVQRDGNVYRPKSFRDPRKPH